MDRSYMLNSYVSENEQNYKNVENANSYLNNFNLRIKGSQSISEIKYEVDMFLIKNNVPAEIKDGLLDICSKLNQNTSVYKAQEYLEEFLTKYLNEKEQEYEKSNDTVNEIKEELVNSVIKDLENVGIEVTGDKEELMENINSEADVYRLKENIDTATEYYQSRNEVINNDNSPTLELDVNQINSALDKPGNEAVLETTLQTEEQTLETVSPTQTEISDDGTLVLQGDALNVDSMNYALLMTAMLVASDTNQIGINSNFDMKFIKKEEDTSKFKIIYGDFPINKERANIDPLLVSKISELSNSYKSNIDYSQLLQQKSPELLTSFMIIYNHILNNKGSFQMAIKNSGKIHEIVFAMDENYSNVSESFLESGAMVSNDTMENNIVRVNSSTPGEQLMLLNATLENLNQRKLEQTQIDLGLQNVYQKKLEYPQNLNEAANVNGTFLTIIAIAEIILLSFFFYFIFK